MTPGRGGSDHRAVAHAIRELPLARVLMAAGAWAFVICVLVQIFLVGLDIFAKVDASFHRDFAYVFGWLAPALVLLSRTRGVPRRTQLLALVLLLLFAAQTVLPSLRQQFPVLGGLHTVNALAIFGVAVTLARRATADLHEAHRVAA
jgi:Family of unknown function (DUF6220)